MIESTFLITEYHKGMISLLFQNQKLQEIGFDQEHQGPRVGNIYRAKVIQVVQNLNAAFVEIAPGQKCFLPFEKLQHAYIPSKSGKEEFSLVQGMEIPIQVEKPQIKSKECVATMNLSLSGEYIVVTGMNKRIGFADSYSQKEKNTLRELLIKKTSLFYLDEKDHFVTKIPYGIIFRSASHNVFLSDHSIDENLFNRVISELQYLSDHLETIIRTSSMRTCYSVLYEAPTTYEQLLRRFYRSIDKIITDQIDVYHHLSKITQNEIAFEGITEYYQDSMISLKNLFSINSLIQDILAKKVWLSSGAYLIIENVETMTVIDVNSGKNSKKADKYQNIVKINLEALPEIVRQIRLRHISGMILIDFMKMKDEEDYKELIEQAKKITSLEHVKTEYVDITRLGLMEIVRKKEDVLLSEQIVQDIS